MTPALLANVALPACLALASSGLALAWVAARGSVATSIATSRRSTTRPGGSITSKRPRTRLDPGSDARPSASAGATGPSPQAPAPSPVLISVPQLGRRVADAVSPASASLERRFGGVWELAEGGASSAAIARATGLPRGQVELILGLRRRPGPDANGPETPNAEGSPRP